MKAVSMHHYIKVESFEELRGNRRPTELDYYPHREPDGTDDCSRCAAGTFVRSMRSVRMRYIDFGSDIRS